MQKRGSLHLFLCIYIAAHITCVQGGHLTQQSRLEEDWLLRTAAYTSIVQQAFRGIVTKENLLMNMTTMSIVVPKPALIIIPKTITTSSSITYFLKKKSMEARLSA